MSNRLKRTLALVIALMMFVGTIFTDNSLFSANAEISGNSGESIIPFTEGVMTPESITALTATPEPSTALTTTLQPTPTQDPDRYEINVNVPESSFYPGEAVEGFTATVTNNGAVISGIVQWSCGEGAAISQDGKLTVNEGTAAGTKVEIKASYIVDGTEKASGTKKIITSVREEVTISGVVKDQFDGEPLNGIIINFSQSTYPYKRSVQTATGDSGEYLITLYKGVEYAREVRDNSGKYNISTENKTYAATGNNENIEVQQNLDFSISGVPQNFGVGDEVELTANFITESWTGTNAQWSSTNTESVSVIDLGNGKARIRGLKMGASTIKAVCRGVEKTVLVNVKGYYNYTIKSIITSNGQKISDANKVYPEAEGKEVNTEVEVTADITVTNNKNETAAITAKSITYTPQKKALDSDSYIDLTDRAVTLTSDLSDVQKFSFDTSGTYRFKIEFVGEDGEWEETSYIEESDSFVVSPKEGQEIKFEKKDSLVYGTEGDTETKQINFEAIVVNNDQSEFDLISVVENGIEKVETLNVEIDEITPVGRDGFYKLKGYISFVVNDITQNTDKIQIRIEYSHKKGVDKKDLVYSDVSDAVEFQVAAKPITVAAVEYNNDRVYNGFTDASIKSITLSGIESRDVGRVSAALTGLQYDRADAGSDHYLLADNMKLNGECKEKYVFSDSLATDLRADELRKGVIHERKIRIATTELSLTKEYYTENPSDEEIAAKVEYENFADGEEDQIKAILQTWHPNYTAASTLESPMKDAEGNLIEYKIIATNPSTEKPEGLSNYTFDLDNGSIDGTPGTLIGTLKIESGKVTDDEYQYVGDAVKEIDRDNIYIRTHSKIDTILVPVNKADQTKYNSVKYTESVADKTEGTEAGEITFILMRTDDQDRVVAESKPRKINYIPDGEIETTINVESYNPEKSTFDGIVNKLTFGIFGNNNNSNAVITYSENLSGIKSQYYDVVDYDQFLIDSENDGIEKCLENYSWKKTVEVKDNCENRKEISFVDGRQIIITRAEDYVGNVHYATSTGIVIDTVRPDVIEAAIEGKTNFNVYNHDVNIWVAGIEDAFASDGNYSGIKEVSYKVLLNDKDGYCDGDTIYEKGSIPTDIQTSSDLKDQANLGGNAIDKITIPFLPEKLNKADEKYKIKVLITAVDYAGNISESEVVEFDFDAVNPDVNVTFDGDVKNNKYFNANRTATIEVTDAYFDEQNIKWTGTDGTTATNWEKVEGKAYTYRTTRMYTINAVHTFDISVTDQAGNNTPHMKDNVPVHYREFVLDKIKPDIKNVKFFMQVKNNITEVNPGVDENGRFYGNDLIYAEIVLEEHNFESRDVSSAFIGGVQLDIKTDRNGENYIAPTHKWLTSDKDPRVTDDMHVLRVTFAGDSNYIYDMEYTDMAGNSLREEFAARYFTVDKTPPTGKIKVNGFSNVWDGLVTIITFGLFSKNRETTAILGEKDATAGVASVQYLVSREQKSVSQLDQAEWTLGNSVTLSPNQQIVVYGKIMDRSGNYYYVSTDGYVLDDTISKPRIDIVTPGTLNSIYNGAVNVRVKVTDPAPTGNYDYAGLKSVYYEVRNTGRVTQTGNLNVMPGATRQQSVEGIIPVDPQKNNSNHVQVYVKVIDNAENMSEETLDLKIDITKPKISVIFNDNLPLNGKYFKDTRTAAVVITERNFDPNNVQINVTNTYGAQASISGWSHSAGESDNAAHTATITFSADGDYTFTVDCTDLAMNKAENPYKSEEFTIDKTIPIINVSYDNNSARNGGYYRAFRTATITITEHNFRAGDVKVTTTASNGSAPGISGWSGSGDRHTATVRFASDADYTFGIDYTDTAGNSAEGYGQDKFTVDLTKPALEITGVANKSANNGTVAPVIKVNDTNFIASGVTLALTGVNKGKINTANMITRANVTNGQMITFLNFGPQMDDIYTLTAKSVDKAGNETTKSVTFSVNRDGSAYDINNATRKLIESGFTNNPQDIVIQETNVDSLEFIEISYSKDGKIVKLTEGKDYTIEMEGGEGQWKKYTYTIFARCFEEEGEYSINISSTDRAENISNNKVQSVNVDFVVDKTAPTMAVSNLENRGRYKEKRHEYTLNVKDNAMLISVEIYLDGKLYKTYRPVNGKLVNADDETEILEMDNGKVYLGVDSRNGYQKIKLISTDAAGNVSETEEYNVLVTTSNWVQFYANRPLFFGSIAVIVIICGFIFFIIRKRRKDEEERKIRRS